MPDNPQSQIQPPTLLPLNEQPLEPQDELALLDSALGAEPSTLDLIIDVGAPQPVGRSWKYDFQLRRYVRGAGQKGPTPTRDEQALLDWTEKCLRTARGAHPIHPPDYGLVQESADLIGGLVGAPAADLEERVRDAATFHPRIADVRDWTFDYDPDDEFQAYSFTLVLDDETTVPVSNLRLAVR